MTDVFRRLFTANVQLAGNLLKSAFYLDARLRPRKRYTLPRSASALLRPSSPKAIPRIVWLTNYTNQVTLSIYVGYLFNRLMAPTFEFRFCDDDDCAEFIKTHFPAEVYDSYARLQIGAAKADFWRILTLLQHGGVYMDIDAALLWPPELFLHAGQTELFICPKDGKLTNYFLATAPGNSVFKAIADRIQQNIAEGSIASVFDMTGPTVVDAVASAAAVRVEPYNVICKQGIFTNKAFQYPDDRSRYWVTAQAQTDIIKKPRVLEELQ
jgi:mannosyltransferase OCH1-like enzyme